MDIVIHDVKLSRLKEEDIELLRTWRNSDAIAQKMIIRKEITPEEQRHWFRSLKPDNDYYFMVTYRGEKTGLMNIKNIDWEAKTGEPGGFIVNTDYLGTYIPAMCFIGLFNFAFYTLQLKTLLGRILADNHASIEMSKAIGGIIGRESDEVYTTTIHEPAYSVATAKFQKAIAILTKPPL